MPLNVLENLFGAVDGDAPDFEIGTPLIFDRGLPDTGQVEDDAPYFDFGTTLDSCRYNPDEEVVDVESFGFGGASECSGSPNSFFKLRFLFRLMP